VARVPQGEEAEVGPPPSRSEGGATSPESTEADWRGRAGRQKPVTPCEGTSGLRGGSSSVATAALLGHSSAPVVLHCQDGPSGGSKRFRRLGFAPDPLWSLRPQLLVCRAWLTPSPRDRTDAAVGAAELREGHTALASATLCRGQGAARPGLRSFPRSPTGQRIKPGAELWPGGAAVATEELPPRKPLVPSHGVTGFWGPELDLLHASVPSGELAPTSELRDP
jgi:hypothetical protein